MFVRVKSTPNSPRQSVQIVESVRRGDQIKQKIVRYVGIAMDDRELEALKYLAESIRIKLEADTQELLFSPEELARLKKQKKNPPIYSDEDYRVNLKHLKEEQRVVDGVHDVYGQLFDELKLGAIFPNPARQAHLVETFKNIVMARLANPSSKRQSARMLEEDFGINLKLDSVYRMMDNLDAAAIEKLHTRVYGKWKRPFA